MTMDRISGYALAGLLVLAPLRFGAVEPAYSAALAAALLALGAVWILSRVRQGMPVLPWREPLLLAAAILLAVAIVQMTPLPAAAVDRISPEASAIRAEYAAPAAWATLSLHPWATRQAALRLVAFALAALVTIDLSATRGMRNVIAGALAAGGAVQAVYGLAEFFSGRQQIFGYVKKYYTDVATGTFINRNHYAGYLELTLPFAIALGAGLLARGDGGSGGSSERSFARRLAALSGRDLFRATLLFLLALVMATALVSSRSRMGLASAGLAFVAVGVAVTLRGKGRVFAAAAVVIAGVTLVLFSQGSGAAIAERFATAAEEFRSGMGRWGMWTQVAGMIAAFPLLGAGLGSFPDVFPLYRSAGAGVAMAHAHNDYMEWTAETGLAGTLLFLLAAYLVLRALVSAKLERRGYGFIGPAAAAGAIAIGIHSVTDFNLAIPANAFTAAVVLGLLVSWRRPAAATLAVDARRRGRWVSRGAIPAGLLLALAALALVPAAATAGSGGAAAREDAPRQAGFVPEADVSILHRAVAALDADDAHRLSGIAAGLGEAALGDLKVLIDDASAGGTPSPTAIGFVEDRLRRAAGIQERSLRFLPTAAEAHFTLGRLRAGLCSAATLSGTDPSGCVGDVMSEMRAAVRLNPMGAATHARAARFLIGAWPVLEGGARDEALDIIDRAAAMNTQDGDLQAAVSFLKRERS